MSIRSKLIHFLCVQSSCRAISDNELVSWNPSAMATLRGVYFWHNYIYVSTYSVTYRAIPLILFQVIKGSTNTFKKKIYYTKYIMYVDRIYPAYKDKITPFTRWGRERIIFYHLSIISHLFSTTALISLHFYAYSARYYTKHSLPYSIIYITYNLAPH